MKFSGECLRIRGRFAPRHCEYEAKTDEMIRDRLVCGVNDMAIQRKLLAEVGLDLKKAVVIAKGMEMATREALKISGTREVHVLDHGKGRRETCFRCGDSRHRAPDCHFREKECFLCKKKGHISKVCSQRKKAGKAPNVNNLEGNEVSGASTSGCSSADALMGASRGIGGLVLRDFQSSEFNDEYTTFFINRTEVRKEAPILIRMKVDGDEVPMELDTGASISVTGKKEWETMTGKSMQLEKTRIRLKTFGGKIIEPLGVSQVQVNYKGQKKQLPIVVTAEPGPILMGRNWLRELELDWKGVLAEIFPMSHVHDQRQSEGTQLESLLQ